MSIETRLPNIHEVGGVVDRHGSKLFAIDGIFFFMRYGILSEACYSCIVMLIGIYIRVSMQRSFASHLSIIAHDSVRFAAFEKYHDNKER